MCCFCHVQLFEITHVANMKSSRTLKVLLGNTHAKTRKLWKHSARLPSLGAIPVDQFTSRLLLHFTRLSRCPLHYLRFPGPQTLHVASCSRRAYHRERRRHLIAPAAEPVPNFPRLRALALFGRRPVERAGLSLLPASKNQHKARSRCASARCAGARAERSVAG